MSHLSPDLSLIFAEARNELFTLRDCLRFAVSQFHRANLFFGHGTDNAWDEAVYLALHTLNLPLEEQLAPYLDARLLPSERNQLMSLYQKRVQERLPSAYLTHEAWLHGHRFYVDSRVIVPRSFIAELLEEHLSPWIENPWETGRVLDLCTGSGCLAILAADAFPKAKIDAIDLSADALAVAKRNISDYGLDDRIRVIQSDALTALGQNDRYDLIICNPPYVNAESVAALPPEYLHEPQMALGSGEDGLAFTRQLLATAHQHLTDNGLLVVEIGHNRECLEACYPNTPFTWLETHAGDAFVFLLHQRDLASCQNN